MRSGQALVLASPEFRDAGHCFLRLLRPSILRPEFLPLDAQGWFQDMLCRCLRSDSPSHCM